MIKKYFMMICDKCEGTDYMPANTLRHAKILFRGAGWSHNDKTKKSTCHECKARRKEKVHMFQGVGYKLVYNKPKETRE